MRKTLLLAGTAATLIASPAAACDREGPGGVHRFNPLAGMLGGGGPAPLSGAQGLSDQALAPEPASVEAASAQQDATTEPVSVEPVTR